MKHEGEFIMTDFIFGWTIPLGLISSALICQVLCNVLSFLYNTGSFFTDSDPLQEYYVIFSNHAEAFHIRLSGAQWHLKMDSSLNVPSTCLQKQWRCSIKSSTHCCSVHYESLHSSSCSSCCNTSSVMSKDSLWQFCH